VLRECRRAATARRERFGTWGGRDRTRIPRQTKTEEMSDA
jgi:hypothetical protein